MLVFTVTNLKGGSTKTTTAAYLLHALHEAGLNVLGVDADGENESLLSWQTLGDWPFPVIGMPVNNLHKQLPGIANNKYDAVVIDTPPMKEQRGDRALVDANCDPCNLPACAHHHGIRQTACSARTTRRGK